MKRIQTLIQSLLLVSALTVRWKRFRRFQFRRRFLRRWKWNLFKPFPTMKLRKSVSFPWHVNVKVDLTSLWMWISAHRCPHRHPYRSLANRGSEGASASCATYEDIEYCYSGYSGVAGQPENEYIHINGTTNREVKMLAFGYAGDAQVEYSGKLLLTVWMPDRVNLIRPSSKMMWWRWEPFPPGKKMSG